MADQNKQGNANNGNQEKDPKKDINQKGGQTNREMNDDTDDLTDLDE